MTNLECLADDATSRTTNTRRPTLFRPKEADYFWQPSLLVGSGDLLVALIVLLQTRELQRRDFVASNNERCSSNALA